MENISLGRSELSVSRICLGTMTFGEQVDQATAHRLLDHAVARGINFIDTAGCLTRQFSISLGPIR
jgi:aryl-alcohol dehydrogenase-like predicted oxidoreductase